MLTYKKNTLLSLLANFKARCLQDMSEELDTPELDRAENIIQRNLTSIEKQIKRL